MNQILFQDRINQFKSFYDRRCNCKEKASLTKKRKLTNLSQGTPLLYPTQSEITSKTFQIKYEKNLSSIAQIVLGSFQNKYLYYAIDDILDVFKSNPIERDNLLEILYSPILSLQNNFSINFFDIWIHEIYINRVKLQNKFLVGNSQKFGSASYITIKFLYRTKIPAKKREQLW